MRLASFHKNMDDAVNWYPKEKNIVVDAAKSEAEVYSVIKAGLGSLMHQHH